jgi:diguanylate cyclase (GGDEF)-like protein/PAS domain S-box-containing protein
MDETTRHILEQMAAGRIPDDIPDSAEYADTLRRLARYFASIQRFTLALSNGDLSQSLQGVTGPVAGGLKSLQSGLRHLTWQTGQIAAGDYSQSVDFMGDFSKAFNAMVADLGAAHGRLQQANRELSREIEGHKRAEKELEFKNAILITQQETTIDGILVVDESNTIVSYNRRFAEIWGIPCASADAGDDVPVFRLVTSQVADEECFLATAKFLYEHKETKRWEELLLKDGRIFDRYSAPMLGTDGTYLGRVCYFRDITERRQMEESQRESRQLLTDVFDFLPDATFVLDNDKKVIAWNRAIEEMTGISKAEMLGQGDYAHSVPFYGVRRPHLLDLIDVDDTELEAKYRYVVRQGNRLHAEVSAPALYGGKGAWIWAFGAPLFNAKGERIGAIEAIRDITAQKHAQLALNESRQRLADIIEFLPDATLIIDSDGSIMAWNRAMEALTGIKAQEMLGKGEYEYAIPFYGDRRPILIDLVLQPDPDREKFYTAFRRDGDTLFGECFVPGLRSSKAYLSTTASVLRDSKGEIVAAIECIRDDTKRKEMEDALRASQHQLALAMDLSRLVKWERDHATGMFTFDDQFYALYDTSADREGGCLMPTEVYVREFVHPDDVPLVAEVIGNALTSVEQWNTVQAEHRIVRRDGELRDIAVKFTALRDDSGNILKLYGANQDITEQKLFEKMLSEQAHTDQMTGANNRSYFLELLDVEIERASRYDRPLCLLMLDLDRFKSVNDTRGHAAGDEAIRTVTRVLQSSGLRLSDFSGRIGGEEFAVALPETGLLDAADAAERVRSQLAATPVSYGSENFSITVSIGVSEYRDGDSQETLLQRADQAMYQAKQTGRNRVCSVS